jgi:hypothetical protein
MLNRTIPFRPKLEGVFRKRFYETAAEMTAIWNCPCRRSKKRNYKLRPGRCQTTNARHILRMAGLL